IRQRFGDLDSGIYDSTVKLLKESCLQANAARNLSGITAHVGELLGELVTLSRDIRERARRASDTATQSTSLARAGETALSALAQALSELPTAGHSQEQLLAVTKNLQRIITQSAEMAAAALSIELASQQQTQLLEEANEVAEQTAKYALESEARAK